MLKQFLAFFLDNKLLTFLLLLLLVIWGLITAPFGLSGSTLPSDPVPVDAIPNLGENQQIVFTSWSGRSPQDIDDQVSYPLTTALLGIPKVRTVRSTSMFGVSSIYVIFEDGVDFYWGRSRILEKLNALPAGLLPEGVQPALGPDATALGQVFWYTLEGVDATGDPTGGWDLPELRSIQDYHVRYALSSVEGVSEVASVGGFVQEYQVDIRPQALQAYDIGLEAVIQAVRGSNEEVGARTLEINSIEYVVRGLGHMEKKEDLESAVVTLRDGVPVRLGDVARVSLGPADRRGMLDKSGAEAVGGVVVARHGANPLAVIDSVKAKIAEIAPGMPRRTLADGTETQLRIVPFYDRSQLIKETLGTLESALSLEILITILVVIIMLVNLRAALLVSGLLPVAVLVCFILMRYLDVEANIVALSGIAIAIGTMVDMAIVLVENIQRRLAEAQPGESTRNTILHASHEVAGAVLAAVLTTIVSFGPVFTMEAAEGKLFRPLAYTKTFALAAAIVLAFMMIPALVHLSTKVRWELVRKLRKREIWWAICGILAMLLLMSGSAWLLPILLILAGVIVMQVIDLVLKQQLSPAYVPYRKYLYVGIAVIAVLVLLTMEWRPLGLNSGIGINLLFVGGITGALLASFLLVIYYYEQMLSWCLNHRGLFLLFPGILLISGFMIWQGFPKTFSPVTNGLSWLGVEIDQSAPFRRMASAFPGVGKEFMPALDEGDFLLMPSAMPHAGTAETRRLLRQLDMAVTTIPEVEMVVGKAGRVESALDPAPLGMFENIVRYKPEYREDETGERIRFQVDSQGEFIRDGQDRLVPDEKGQYFRNWRDHIHGPDDIWDEIAAVSQLPGLTRAPKLQPIETRLLMLQTGMRAPMGIKVKGPHLDSIQTLAEQLAEALREVPEVRAEAVFADRIVGKPYLQLEIDRERIARYGLQIADVQRWIAVAIGGKTLTQSVEGRERYAVRLRYPREMRDSPDAIGRIVVAAPNGQRVPLEQLVDITFEKGPQMIRSEDTFLTGYVLFDKRPGEAEVNVVEAASAHIREKITQGSLVVPTGTSYSFTGSYENQVRADKRLALVLPIVLGIIFLILYFQFRSIPLTLMVFSGIAVAFAGGFIMIWLYGQPWFLNFSILGANLRDLFNIETVNLSVAVWVGFIALFGIATDDGVVIATFLKQSFGQKQPRSVAEIRKAVIVAGQRRIRPCLMTTATTLLALLPILASQGKGSDIMIPMAIPVFGGMAVELITLFIVPVLYAWWHESAIKSKQDEAI